jgi:parvulin-like peptidyl-prolyl isomerase
VARLTRTLLAPAALIAGALGLLACGSSSSDSSSLPQGVVAQVADSQITAAELQRSVDQQAAAAKAQGQTFPKQGTAQFDQVRASVLQQIVLERIVDFEANKCGPSCKVTPKAIDQQLDMIRNSSQFGGSEKKFKKFLADRKLTMADARRILRYQLEQPKLVSHVTRKVRFTAADAKKYYDENPSQFRVPAQRQARHILVKDKALADKISGEVDNGNFASLAKRYSIDPGSKSQGGELGAIQKGQVVPEFEKVVFSLKDGQISKPFKTQFGWHIVQVQITPARHQSFAQAKSQIISTQLSSKRNAEFTKWRDKILGDYQKRTTYADEKLKPPETTAQATPTPTTTP